MLLLSKFNKNKTLFTKVDRKNSINPFLWIITITGPLGHEDYSTGQQEGTANGQKVVVQPDDALGDSLAKGENHSDDKGAQTGKQEGPYEAVVAEGAVDGHERVQEEGEEGAAWIVGEGD